MTINAIHNFITSNKAPEFGYKQKWITGLGSFLLIPTTQALGLYYAAEEDAPTHIKVAYKAASIFLTLLLVPLTILGSLIKGIGLALPQHKYEESELTDTALNVWKMPPEESREIYRLLDAFNEVCKEIGLRYCLASGTLLGAERHKGVIPWDSDADVMILAKDEHFLLDAADTFLQKGLFIEKNAQEGLYKLGFVGRKPYLDVFLRDWFTAEGSLEPKLHFLSPMLRTAFPRDYFAKTDFAGETIDENWQLPIIEMPFGPNRPGTNDCMQLPLPAIDRDTALKRIYGKKCLEEGILTHTHPMVFGSIIAFPNFTQCRFKLTDFNPAPWTE